MSHVREKELTSNVAILLSSYNGGVYLKEQLDSLIAQDYENYHVFCRDDGSKDNTVDILKEYSLTLFQLLRDIVSNRIVMSIYVCEVAFNK